MRILVATTVHNPEDARIRHRQIPALLAAGHTVIYLAPKGDRTPSNERLERVVVPRSIGRHRFSSMRHARNALRTISPTVDLTILHDPELVLLTRAITGPVIWDVHEDLEAQIIDKAWLPRLARPPVRWGTSHLVNRGIRLDRIIAEKGYQERHPDALLVPNTVLPASDADPSARGRLVYVGGVTPQRGSATMAEAARILAASQSGITVDVIGPTNEQATRDWVGLEHCLAGFVPNDVALKRASGATAGLSLLQNRPNYSHSLPTKLLEYMARGIPVISTPLPAAVEIVEKHRCGVLVDFDDPAAVAEAAITLDGDDDLRAEMADRGRRAIERDYNWEIDGQQFVAFCESIANPGSHPRKVIPR